VDSIRGVILWAIWIERKNLVFNNTKWHDAKLGKVICDDYGRFQWQHTLCSLLKNIQRTKKDSIKHLTKCHVLTGLFACVIMH
jgi:hypothetical protein